MKKKIKSKGVVLSGEYLYIPIEFRGKGLNLPALQVFSWVYGMYLNSEWVKISDSNLGNKLDLSRSSILRSKKELQDLGLIKVTSIPGGVSEYNVNIERIGEYFNLKIHEESSPAKNEKEVKKAKTKKQMSQANSGGMFKYE